MKNVSFDIAPRRVLRPCRRIRLRQEHHRLRHQPPAPSRRPDPAGSQILLDGRDVLTLDDAALQQLRWREIGMVFQSAMNSLNPVLTRRGAVPRRAEDPHRHVARRSRGRAPRRCSSWSAYPVDRLRAYPHQFSGGMRQRIVIAICLALEPEAASSWTSRPRRSTWWCSAKSSSSIIELRSELGFSVLFITHDLPLMVQVCDRIGIMLEGELVEVGDVAGDLPLAAPRLHAQALGLDPAPPRQAIARGCRPMNDAAPILALDNVTKFFGRGRGAGLLRRASVSFALHPGRTLALVGESGSGKTTAARLIMREYRPTRGACCSAARQSKAGAAQPGRPIASAVQMVFQDPFPRSTRSIPCAITWSGRCGCTAGQGHGTRGCASPNCSPG